MAVKLPGKHDGHIKEYECWGEVLTFLWTPTWVHEIQNIKNNARNVHTVKSVC
jgi:hypothetical protein